jgi:hypothetical protein
MSISRGPNELLLAAAPIEYHWPQLLLNDFSLSSNEIQLSAAQKKSRSSAAAPTEYCWPYHLQITHRFIEIV